jgi:hypothetical protein
MSTREYVRTTPRRLEGVLPRVGHPASTLDISKAANGTVTVAYRASVHSDGILVKTWYGPVYEAVLIGWQTTVGAHMWDTYDLSETDRLSSDDDADWTADGVSGPLAKERRQCLREAEKRARAQHREGMRAVATTPRAKGYTTRHRDGLIVVLGKAVTR